MREKARKKKKTASQPSRSGTSNRNMEFAVITYMFLGIFILMMGYFVYFQVVRSEDVINSPYNKRQDTFAKHVVRGEIRSADGMSLAQTVVGEDGTETRYYPYGNMFAHAIGYDVYGKSGIESFANFNLLRSHAFFAEQILNGIQSEKNPGDTVVTTLNYKLQEVAYHALGENNGAIIVLEPSTGKILAMVSRPDFNPNTLAQEWDGIISDEESSVLLNRVTQGLYPPGSAFKILTTLEYIHENPSFPDYAYDCTGSITVEENEDSITVINCYKGAVHDHEDLLTAFAKSCNAAYASIGLELDQNAFAALCNSMLFHTDMPTAYPFKQSSFVLNNDSSTSQIMQTAIGQGETLMTPMHMALITSAIANDGILMRPYVIGHTENYKGIAVKEYHPSIYSTLLSESDAAILQGFMEQVVTDGTGSKLNGGNYKAAGKTGSAEYSNTKGESHAWFTGYASADGIPSADGMENAGGIAVTVIVEGGGAGSETAVPIAKQIFDAYYK